MEGGARDLRLQGEATGLILWVSCGEGPGARQSLGPRGVRAERRAQPFLGLSRLGCALQVAAEEEMLGCGVVPSKPAGSEAPSSGSETWPFSYTHGEEGSPPPPISGDRSLNQVPHERGQRGAATEDGAPDGKSQASERILEKRSVFWWWGGCIPRGRHPLTCPPSLTLLAGRLVESEQIK